MSGSLAAREIAAVDRLLATARHGLDRVRAEDLPAEVASGTLLIDSRPLEQRQRDGELHGALVIDRSVLEWRLDPRCAHRLPQADGAAERRVILVCNEGFSSSLADPVISEDISDNEQQRCGVTSPGRWHSVEGVE